MKRLVIIALLLSACSTPPPAGMEVSARIRLSGEATAIASGNGIWVSVLDGDIVRIDEAAATIGATIKHPREPGGSHAVSIDGTDIWFANPVGSDPPSGFDPGSDASDVQDVYRRFEPARADLFAHSVTGNIVHVDAGSNAVVQQLAFLDFTPTSVAAGGGGAWVPTPAGLRFLDPQTHRFGDPLDIPGDRAIASGGHIWVASDSAITGLDPGTGTSVVTIDVGAAGAGDINDYTIDGDAVWVTTDQALLKFDGKTGETLGSLALDRPFHLAAANGVVLVLGLNDGILTRVDPDRLTAADQIDLGFDDLAGGIAIGETGAWIAAGERVLQVSVPQAGA